MSQQEFDFTVHVRKQSDNSGHAPYFFTLEYNDFDVDDVLAGPDGLVWEKIADDEDISIEEAKKLFYVHDIVGDFPLKED